MLTEHKVFRARCDKCGVVETFNTGDAWNKEDIVRQLVEAYGWYKDERCPNCKENTNAP